MEESRTITKEPMSLATDDTRGTGDTADHDREGASASGQSYWRSRPGLYLIGAFVIGGLVLGYEYRAYIPASGLLLALPLLLCVGMHFFMHGGHGGHGGKDDG